MKIYARIENGTVAEIFATEGNIAAMFHPDLVWVDITDIAPAPAPGWTYADGVFAAPTPPPPLTPQPVYVPAWLVRERLQTAGKWDAAWEALNQPANSALLGWFLTLQQGVAPDDANAIALLTSVGADPAVILAAP